MRKKMASALALTLTLGVAAGASAATPDSQRILWFGCSQSGQCSVKLSGSITVDTSNNTVAACSSPDTLRWDATTPQGQNMMTVMMAAYLSGKTVKVWRDTTCVTVGSITEARLAWLRSE